MMKRATWIYVMMTLAFVGGLWAILRMGSGLKPPPNVGGNWRLAWQEGEVSPLPMRMSVSQSGKFLSVAMEQDGGDEDRMSGHIERDRPWQIALAGREGRSVQAAIVQEGSVLRGVYWSGKEHPFVASREEPRVARRD